MKNQTVQKKLDNNKIIKDNKDYNTIKKVENPKILHSVCINNNIIIKDATIKTAVPAIN